jgi:phosphatidylglycerophosphatase A
MSDSSTSSAGNDRIAARLRLMAPGGRWEIFGDRAGEVDAVDAFCVTSSGSAEEIRGFVLRMDKAHRIPEKLGDVVGKLLHQRGLPAWFGALCRPDSMVGSRICHVSAPGLRDRFYQREGLVCQKAPSGDKLRDLLCSVAGLGHLPLVGATGASFVTCLLALALMPLLSPDAWKFLLLAMAVAASVICALLEKWSHRHYLAEDPREVVLDEVAGMALALAIAGPGFWTVAAAFFAFRFFDIFKPGIHWIEERGWDGTIVWDDLLAGLYAGGSVVLGVRIISFIFS